MPRRVRLCRYETVEINICRTAAVALRIEATDVMGGMDPNVFVWEREPPDHNGDEWEVFQAVASAVDMANLPADNPEIDADPRYFRRNWIHVVLQTHAQAQQYWEQISKEVCRLPGIMDRLDTLRVAEDVWCRCGEGDSSDSSESSASSESSDESISVSESDG